MPASLQQAVVLGAGADPRLAAASIGRLARGVLTTLLWQRLLPRLGVAAAIFMGMTVVAAGAIGLGRGNPAQRVDGSEERAAPRQLSENSVSVLRKEEPVLPARKPRAGDQLPGGAILRYGSPLYRHPTTIDSLAVSRDGTRAVASSGGRVHAEVRLYDLATGDALRTFDPGVLIEAVALSPDGKTIAARDAFRHTVTAYSATSGEQTAQVVYPYPSSTIITDLLVFSPDGTQLAMTSAEGPALDLISLAQGKVVRTYRHANVVFAAAFSPDGKELVAGGYDSENDVYFARIWEVDTGREVRRLPYGQAGIRCVAYAPDGATIAIGGDRARDTLAIKLFDTASGRERLSIDFPDPLRVRSLAFSPDGRTLAASGSSTSRLFDTSTGQERLKIDRGAIGLRYAADGRTLVAAVAGTIDRWDAATGQVLIPEGGESPVAQIAVTPNGQHIVTRGEDGDAHVWNARTGEHLRRVNVSAQRVCPQSGWTLSRLARGRRDGPVQGPRAAERHPRGLQAAHDRPGQRCTHQPVRRL